MPTLLCSSARRTSSLPLPARQRPPYLPHSPARHPLALPRGGSWSGEAHNIAAAWRHATSGQRNDMRQLGGLRRHRNVRRGAATARGDEVRQLTATGGARPVVSARREARRSKVQPFLFSTSHNTRSGGGECNSDARSKQPGTRVTAMDPAAAAP